MVKLKQDMEKVIMSNNIENEKHVIMEPIHERSNQAMQHMKDSKKQKDEDNLSNLPHRTKRNGSRESKLVEES